ncbi:MAG: hypothetical protein EA397_19355 [Deltaproteobacteria bacterium]|nr:MAG: hypothetical protein EA397_19355 [Deltaproteobacteria bacterium]
MARRGEGLAARFKAAIEAKQRSDEAKDRKVDDVLARQARDQLFQDLLRFAEATGFVQARTVEGGVELTFEDRKLTFRAHGDADGVELDWQGRSPQAEHLLYREPLLQDRWIWRYRWRGKEHRVPFFDQGLEVLLIEALGLPDLNDG